MLRVTKEPLLLDREGVCICAYATDSTLLSLATNF